MTIVAMYSARNVAHLFSYLVYALRVMQTYDDSFLLSLAIASLVKREIAATLAQKVKSKV